MRSVATEEGKIGSPAELGEHQFAKENLQMTRDEFLLQMDEILSLPAGTLRGHEKLEELENWDSTSLIT